MIGWTTTITIIVLLLIISFPGYFIYAGIKKKKKYPYKVIMNIRRNNGYITNTKLKGGIVKDSKGVPMFEIPFGWKKSYTTRELPPSNIILSDNTIYTAKVGETILFLDPKVQMNIKQDEKGTEVIEMEDQQGKNVVFTPVTPQTKYQGIKDIGDAFKMVEAGGFDWKPIIAYGGLVLLFVGVIVVTYLIWERIDIGAIQQLTETNKQIAQTNMEIVEKLRNIRIGG